MPESLYRGAGYRIGLALDPQTEDPHVIDYTPALDRAAKMVAAYGSKTPIAMWENDEIILVWMCGQCFRREGA